MYLSFLIGRLSKWVWERQESDLHIRLSHLEEFYFYLRFHVKPKLLSILNDHRNSRLFLWIACNMVFQHGQQLDEFCTRYHWHNQFNCCLCDQSIYQSVGGLGRPLTRDYFSFLPPKTHPQTHLDGLRCVIPDGRYQHSSVNIKSLNSSQNSYKPFLVRPSSCCVHRLNNHLYYP